MKRMLNNVTNQHLIRRKHLISKEQIDKFTLHHHKIIPITCKELTTTHAMQKNTGRKLCNRYIQVSYSSGKLKTKYSNTLSTANASVPTKRIQRKPEVKDGAIMSYNAFPTNTNASNLLSSTFLVVFSLTHYGVEADTDMHI